MTKSFTISAPSRIHFGLFSIAEEAGYRFGGAGVMIRKPACTISVHKSNRFKTLNDEEQLLESNAIRWFDSNKILLPHFEKLDDLPICLELTSRSYRHSGFGSGTQTAMTVAAALFHAFEFEVPNAENLAAMMQRGKRSAIGTHGFLNGGFLVDQGLTKNTKFSKLDLRIDFPAGWRFVLVVPNNGPGLHGTLENTTFDELISRSGINRSRLVQLCTDAIVPSIAGGDYEALGEPLHEFNRLSGEYFAQYQFGCYHSELCAQIVDDFRDIGVNAVGQSSWGPCIFAIVENDDRSIESVARLRQKNPKTYSNSNVDIMVTKPDNQGVRIMPC